MPSLFLVIFGLAIIIRFYALDRFVPFIADQGWFFLQARDALLTGRFPLLGITTSVTWLHQGPLYTYFLIPELALSGFHPLSGVVFTVLLDLLTLILIFWLARVWFNRRTALISSAIYAGSPLVILHSRLAYHTSLIPLILCLFLLFFTRKKYFIAFLFLGFLYQLELASVIFWPLVLFYLVRRHYAPRSIHLLAICLGIFPFILAGITPALGIFFWGLIHGFSGSATGSAMAGYMHYYDLLFIPAVPVFSVFILILLLTRWLYSPKLLYLWFVFPALVFLLIGQPSEAYFSLIIVPLIILFSAFLSGLPRLPVIFFILIYTGINLVFLIRANYLLGPGGYGNTLFSQISLSSRILSESSTPDPQLEVSGLSQNYPDSADSYRYLIFWLSRSRPPTGGYSLFEIQEPSQTFRVLK